MNCNEKNKISNKTPRDIVIKRILAFSKAYQKTSKKNQKLNLFKIDFLPTFCVIISFLIFQPLAGEYSLP